MILIYTHISSARIKYVMDLVFNTVLDMPYELTNDRQQYERSDLPKLAYTKEINSTGITIKAQGLLLEKGISGINPVADNSKDFPVFFPSLCYDFLGYDLFAMVFYFATRYEEYGTPETDQHQRFKAEASIAFKNSCLNIPFLNLAINDFAKKLKQEFPSLEFKKRPFNFLSTIDIDNAFAYAHKGFKRNAGGLLKDAASLKFSKVYERIKSNADDRKDPYNTFEKINALSHDTNTKLQYFVLIGDHAAYDKNPDHRNAAFRKLLKDLSEKYPLGLHPSYESFNDPTKIETEKKRLEAITGKKVTSARCHFLRIKFPDTYRHFIKAGITDDYTMIYASQGGFRTGLCVPYKWFDLEKNEATDLTIHTSAVMEGTLRDYNKLSPEEAKSKSLAFMTEVKKQGGEFISIFHNDTFVPAQTQWLELYKTLLKESKA